ncbi:hypothetical protein ACH41H_47530 [Streptomyces sp. NPDC020800]|uniref:hypothetical protein n=1 Tax=Streptomyces sp. NPDC020800 TaxID=3365092 RepID=UPI0037AED797
MTYGIPAHERALAYEWAARAYAVHRPRYPAAVFETVEEFSGQRPAGARVADVGTGTGVVGDPVSAQGEPAYDCADGRGGPAPHRGPPSQRRSSA